MGRQKSLWVLRVRGPGFGCGALSVVFTLLSILICRMGITGVLFKLVTLEHELGQSECLLAVDYLPVRP